MLLQRWASGPCARHVMLLPRICPWLSSCLLADCEVEDVVVLAEVLTFAGLGVDLLVPLHEVALVAEEEAEAPTAAAAAG